MSDPLLQVACAVLLLLVPLGLGLVLARASADRIATLVALVAGGAASLLLSVSSGAMGDPPARVLDAVLAGAVAAVIALLSIPRLGRVGAPHSPRRTAS